MIDIRDLLLLLGFIASVRLLLGRRTIPSTVLDLHCQQTVASYLAARNSLGKKDFDLFHLDWVKGTLTLVMDG